MVVHFFCTHSNQREEYLFHCGGSATHRYFRGIPMRFSKEKWKESRKEQINTDSVVTIRINSSWILCQKKKKEMYWGPETTFHGQFKSILKALISSNDTICLKNKNVLILFNFESEPTQLLFSDFWLKSGKLLEQLNQN